MTGITKKSAKNWLGGVMRSNFGRLIWIQMPN